MVGFYHPVNRPNEKVQDFEVAGAEYSWYDVNIRPECFDESKKDVVSLV